MVQSRVLWKWFGRNCLQALSLRVFDMCRSLSCLPALQELLQTSKPPAVLILGAGGNNDCIPRPSNYNAFFKACSDAKQAMSEPDEDNPLPAAAVGAAGDSFGVAGEEAKPDALMVVVQDAGHLQFLDTESTLQR